MSHQPASPAPPSSVGNEHLEGLVEPITVHSPETGFCVLKVRFCGLRPPTALIDKLPQIHVGEWIKVDGH